MKLDQGSYEFFRYLSEVVKPFRSQFAVPGANVEGCLVVRHKSRKKQHIIRFGFMAKGDNIVTVDIDSRAITANPKEYIENMLAAIEQGMQQMKDNVKIVVPTTSQMKQVLH